MAKRASWNLWSMLMFWLNLAVDYVDGGLKGLMYNLRFGLKTGVPLTLAEHADMAERIHENPSKAIDYLKAEVERCDRKLGVQPVEVKLAKPDPKVAQLEDAIEALLNAAQAIERAPRTARNGKVTLPKDVIDGLLETLAAWRKL